MRNPDKSAVPRSGGEPTPAEVSACPKCGVNSLALALAVAQYDHDGDTQHLVNGIRHMLAQSAALPHGATASCGHPIPGGTSDSQRPDAGEAARLREALELEFVDVRLRIGQATSTSALLNAARQMEDVARRALSALAASRAEPERSDEAARLREAWLDGYQRGSGRTPNARAQRDANDFLAAALSRGDAPTTPEKCVLCGRMMDPDRAGHGLGECVEICPACNGSGAAPDESAALSRGEED